jgi:hypothetical protein
MEHSLRKQTQVTCPECHKTGKIERYYSSGNKFVPMILTQCETCLAEICGSCWEKHYLKHTERNPKNERLDRCSGHFDYAGEVSDLLERSSGGVHSDLAPGARIQISLSRETISDLRARMRTRI